ncbi:DUF2490 domain-containing protein [Mucilaginibacter sp. Bleaf8]|uniref:DUF2490 domain-containing protein n=1 Tax=Mucilaginibacter sp. Bleaf8 TaxID=2834430 RepID=UPI001BCB5520|nr:DUF2490 domain-containing protein [Mucilaginibacter sp. Bleaf8]MBS7564166.1 DUF2490 domain-containing protein [Mucilaginibacter sp. Bleaf8]
MRRIILFVFISSQLLIGKAVLAQTKHEHSLWGAWFHTQRFSKHWGAMFDIQMRSADDVEYLRHTLLRPGVSYYFNNRQFTTLGYLYTYTRNQTDAGKTFRPEHRIWQQFIQAHTVHKNIAVQHRFRLEQRFVGSLNTQDAFFAQRLRYFIRGVIPFKRDSTFSKGMFLGLQNEVFTNVQNKDKVNGSFFDQNRAYAALGYRFNKSVDIEAGYLNQYVNGAGPANINNNIIQVALYTRLSK